MSSKDPLLRDLCCLPCVLQSLSYSLAPVSLWALVQEGLWALSWINPRGDSVEEEQAGPGRGALGAAETTSPHLLS